MAFDKPIIEQAILDQMSFLNEEVQFLHSTGMKWIEAVVQFCEDRNLEVEEIVEILPPSIVQNIKEEAILARTVEGEISTPLWN